MTFTRLIINTVALVGVSLNVCARARLCICIITLAKGLMRGSAINQPLRQQVLLRSAGPTHSAPIFCHLAETDVLPCSNHFSWPLDQNVKPHHSS